MSCSLIPTATVQDGAAVTENPDGSVLINLSGPAAAQSVLKFCANLAAKMDEGELNTIASELLDVCALLQANAKGGMLPAAGPEKVRDDRPQKPKSADVIGHNDDPARDRANPFSTAPAPRAGTIYAGDPTLSPASALPAAVPPHPPAAAGMRLCDRRLPSLPGDGCACLPALWPVLGWAPPLPATPVILGMARARRDQRGA